ncbi:hypothetical protein BG46_15560 [Brucella anthropi]|uniref:hypothetical protein n=1 Tax=Brucella anthropi TaxID=529 RepID=UPI00044DC89D|nr:hypothetical protein [Brucella anthropi]EXL06203.1 hypothetical protein BG46_15560 [Brucella anthropi]
MAIRPDYQTGTIDLVASSADFTTTGAALQMVAVQPGDAIITPSGHVLIIATITGQNSGTLFLPCPPDAAGTGLPLRIRFQPDGSRYQGAVRNLIDLLSSGNVEALAALVGADGMVPIFTGPGTLDLADPATFGIQDPNGSLGKLAALTLAARQILQTDATGALTAITLAARQILQTDANGALTPVSLTANKTLRTDVNADIVLANVEKPLLASYGGADINGLSQIVFDIPNYYVGAEVEIRSIRSASASGSVGFRCGPAGGTLVTDYRIRNWNQYGAGDLTWSMTTSRDLAEISPISTSLANLTTATIQFGTGTSGWHCLFRGAGWDPGAGFYKTDRAAWSNANGIMRRLAIVSTVPLGSDAATSIRIYGVR